MFHVFADLLYITGYYCTLYMQAVPNPCLTINGGCSHLCLLSAVDPTGYICDCPNGMVLDDGPVSNCTFQNEITTVTVLSPSLHGPGIEI